MKPGEVHPMLSIGGGTNILMVCKKPTRPCPACGGDLEWVPDDEGRPFWTCHQCYAIFDVTAPEDNLPLDWGARGAEAHGS